jgi:hypothetical protein
MQCAMAPRLSEIFWLYQPIGHDPLNQLPAMIFPKPAGMRLATYIVAHFGSLKPTFVGMRTLNLVEREDKVQISSAHVLNPRDRL